MFHIFPNTNRPQVLIAIEEKNFRNSSVDERDYHQFQEQLQIAMIEDGKFDFEQ